MQSRPRALSAGMPAPDLTGGMIGFFAFCCGAIVANIYYAQPIIGLIAPDIGMSPRLASLIVSLTQIGYALGLFFLVPLGDLVENRRLMIITTVAAVVSLAGAALSASPSLFLLLSLMLGFSSVSVQIIIPMAAHMAPEASRGRVVGSIMSGLLLGILLARPASSFIAGHFGWRAVFASASVLMLVFTLMFAMRMPMRRPQYGAGYAALLRSLGTLILRHRVLRERALLQACMFGSFSLFWTAAPLELARSHGFTQQQIAVFCLVGAIGAVAAPVAGRLADAGHVPVATMTALILGVLSYVPGALLDGHWSIIGLGVTAVVLDFCVQMNMVMGQREIYALDAASRGRLNALYMTSIFIGGAVGSSMASALYSHGGWLWVTLAGGGFLLLALLRYVMSR
ncbi:Predicted arabinose efflux permease, MFS family [Noviherbaspirillum humi]|uniref:Predicted arabinose efflux permease, MFS family n=1 Tax=Noviherbaspirillum humi TaxID=1688639 RepID=A0A239LHS0_9BURK|nr:MFS transporter [Noviherbaspirillum humi]SNT30136.1 Predicted arabinose efflux permease, MFS family [Noviherbaspirillum humi]